MLRYTIFLITFLVCNQSLLSGNGAITQSSSSNGFRWTSDDVIFHVHGPDSTSIMGFQVGGLGDVNGDGYDDVAISYYRSVPYNEYAMNIYFGGSPPDTIPDMTFGRGMAFNPSTIDVNGDEIKDLVIGAYGVTSGFKSGVFFVRGYGDSLASVAFDSICPQIDNQGFGERHAIAYTNIDAWPDLIASRSDVPFPESTSVFYFQNPMQEDTIADWQYKISKSRYNLGDMGFVDFNGDRSKDIFLTLLESNDTLPKVLIFFGPLFNTTPDITIGAPADSNQFGPRFFADGVFSVGDIDGDSYDDIVVDYANDYYIYNCGPSADTVRDYRLNGKFWYAAAAGDVNGDNQPDLAVGNASFFGSVSAFLGGTFWDPNRDATIDRNDLPAIEMDRIGYRVASAGDVDADGFDDVIFSTQNFTNGEHGDVFIVKGGPHIVTDVESDSHGLVSSMDLHPNYPNPFNPSTTISFDLPRRARVTLSIVNILGQVVAKLVDGEIAAGSHSVEWDGRDASGEVAASGVYLYRLETDDGVLSRKMLLLK